VLPNGSALVWQVVEAAAVTVALPLLPHVTSEVP
jgi:hypothetical protein